MSEHPCVRYKKLMNIFSSFSLSLYGIFKFILLFNHFDLLIYNETDMDIYMNYFFIFFSCMDIFTHCYLNIPMNLLTVKIHHPFYILFVSSIIYHHITNIFSLFFLEEIPTCLLNISLYNSNYRHDNLFGFTFLSSRILYHIILLSFLMNKSFIPSYVKYVGIFVYNVHCVWFYKWCIKNKKLK